ncbi:type IV pilin protein [Marinobacterium rhizophilum]|uniref:Prepilin-type N-terminal cleavage/methylation domain-containing protein n=1 Tax=Marinobacterium rhizophilum TaxID=420402 RepID=A0ABY5HGZ9_9GAMM|nr:type IV pilin protein [Marinobacterium rhizophilum]UTW11111.1 prepilin-type N-terminal cleavage/methylation domain-containing protein [Marinobacterium rhizophilum]
MNYSARGFTLIELMIVVVVISVIAMFAYPAYLDQVRKARRAEAQKVLMAGQISEERYRSYFNTYGDGTSLAAENLGMGTADFFTFGVTVPGASAATHYTLTASASGDQLKDSNCTVMTLDQSNVMSPAACWKR